MKPILIITLLLAGGITASAQVLSIDSDSIKWEVTGLEDTKASVNADYACYFVSCRSSLIRWVQGDYVLDFRILSDQGRWSDISKSGSKVYKVSLGEKRGTITFNRSGGKTTVTFEFVEGGENLTPYVFTVSSTQKAPAL